MAVATPTIAVHDGRTLAAAHATFNMVAFHWRGAGGVTYRVRLAHGWSSWRAADADHVERGWHLGNLDWVGTAGGLQTRPALGVRAYTVWSPVDSAAPQRRLQIANAPPIIPRLSWGADESIRRAPPEYAPALKFAVIHHTAGTNDYTRAESAAIVRGIELYHVKGNGWNDIGYNFLVDKYGQVFEGRYGGVDRPVIGAHVEGFNTASLGVSVIGDYTRTRISAAAASSLAQLLAWRFDLAHIDPLSSLTVASKGNSRYPTGTPVVLRAVSAHRDAYFTDCPGNALYAQIPAIAKAVAALGGPKIYAPAAVKTDETHTRFTARLSASVAWTVTITSSAGAQVAQGSGTGAAVDWTWDGTAAPPDRYLWTIAAGTARPATGTLGATTALTLQKVTAVPTTVAAGQPLTIGYVLGAPASVTATLVDPSGQTIATLLTVRKPAGAQTIALTLPTALANGIYTVAITATAGAKAVTANAPFTVDDILASFGVTTTTATLVLSRVPLTATLEILDGTATVASPYVALLAGPQTISWPALPEGEYTVALTIADDLGEFTRALPLVVDTTPPEVTVVSYRNMRFRISEPATLTLVVGAARYTRVVRRAAATQFWLRTKPRAYTLRVTDAAGNTTTVRYRS